MRTHRAPHLDNDLLGISSRLVVTPVEHHIDTVGQRHHSSRQWGGLGFEAIRVTRAVPTLVMPTRDGREALQAGNVAQQRVPKLGVAFDPPKLLAGQLLGFGE